MKGYSVTEKTGAVVGLKVVEGSEDLLIVNDAGVIIRMAVDGVNTYSRSAQGVKLMNLDEGVKVISIALTEHEEDEESSTETVDAVENNPVSGE